MVDSANSRIDSWFLLPEKSGCLMVMLPNDLFHWEDNNEEKNKYGNPKRNSKNNKKEV